MRGRPWFYRKTITKSFIYFVFGAGAVGLITAVFPAIRLFVWNSDRRDRALRFSVHVTFKLFMIMMRALGMVEVRISDEDRAFIKGLTSSVVVANHPSLLDVTFLFAFLPHADCVVKSDLFRRPIIRHVVGNLYISNRQHFDEIIDQARKTLDAGNTLIVFPEGSRTHPGEEPHLQKGSARIALRTERPVVPIIIEHNDMRGLQKGDPLYRINEEGRYRFQLRVQRTIPIESYRESPMPIAGRRLTAEIGEGIGVLSRR